MTPRITFGIPTHNRPELLPHAIDSALNQTVPCRIIVADDGNSDDTLKLLMDRYESRYPGGTTIRHLPTGEISLWENWTAAAKACDTEFFAWLQDDDVVRPQLAERIIAAFDAYPAADTYLACNKIALDRRHIWWNNGNGPWVPLEADGVVDQWECEIFRPTCYFLSWSLSPAVAFRVGDNFTRSLDAMPLDCAIFAERLILAGMTGRFVADPYVAGLWIQHNDNESRNLHDDQPRQSTILISKLDKLMDETPNWEEVLLLWAKLQMPNWIIGWLNDLAHIQREGGKSRYGEAIHNVLFKSLEGRVRFMPRYKPWRRAVNWLIDRVRSRAAL